MAGKARLRGSAVETSVIVLSAEECLGESLGPGVVLIWHVLLGGHGGTVVHRRSGVEGVADAKSILWLR